MTVTELRSQKIKVVADRAKELSKLKEHPSWEVLRDEYETKRRLFMERLARKIMARGTEVEPLDQREIDYQRGFFAGAAWILDNPDMAEASLEQALRHK